LNATKRDDLGVSQAVADICVTNRRQLRDPSSNHVQYNIQPLSQFWVY